MRTDIYLYLYKMNKFKKKNLNLEILDESPLKPIPDTIEEIISD
jgi:hypothetical protein